MPPAVPTGASARIWPGVKTHSVNLTNTTTGWAAGAGVEYAIQPNWSIKVEYLRLMFDNNSATATTAGMLNPLASVPHLYNANLDSNIVRVGLNWRLGYGGY
jgi:outer membrane immunogenic protein